ncbi:DEAD/DEAH box helicase [Candidatus Pacearchaeota archaeon]|nr:DEAD/DEAH box helicase [Candidatus Pacearchaeota archaeon]
MENKHKYRNFQEYCVEQIRVGNTYASRFLKDGKNALALALDEGRKKLQRYESQQQHEHAGKLRGAIERAEEKGMIDGSFEMTYEGAERIYQKVRTIVEKKGAERNTDYMNVFDAFDPIADHDLIATGIFCLIPEVREKVGNKLENLYRVVLNVGAAKRKGYSLPMKERSEKKQEDSIISASLERLIAALPKIETSEEQQYHKMLKVLIEKKIEREVFPLFQKDAGNAFNSFNRKIREEKNDNLREAYTRLKDVYEGYSAFKAEEVNQEFIDPETKRKGVLPSLHQKIAIYHSVNEEKFGIFDGCGTGKTAIGVLTQPLVEKKLKEEGKEFRRAVVVCPNAGKKTWKKGLTGNDAERYLADRQDIAVINGEQKTPEFLASLRDKRWIVTNYEQLTTKVGEGEKTFAEELAGMGVDYVIFDECHHIKGLRTQTPNGAPTQSAAARILGHNARFVSLLSGSPIPDSLKDYAVLYHLLNPQICPDPNKFDELYQNNPRILYTFVNEKTIRRTSEAINEDLDWNELEELVELDDVQRTLYNHIIEFRPGNWMNQARKALLDPRLVDPEVIQRAGLIGKIGVENSAKYKSLENLLVKPDGPISKQEKFIIFSSMYKEGVTNSDNEELRNRYDKLGLSEEYTRLGLNQSLDQILKSNIEKKLGRKVNIGLIDGDVKNIEDREAIVDRLNHDLDGILCTTDTGGESLNFTPANHAFFLDDDYTPKTNEQAIARLVRKGQTKKVNIWHLRGKDTLDEKLTDYVEKKAIIIKTALDGYPLTKEEKELLEDTQGRKLGDLIKRSVGGISINVLDATIDAIDDFESRKRSRGRGEQRARGSMEYETTDAQRVTQWIGKDPLNCWSDPQFVELYMNVLPNLSVPVIHRAKICDLIGRAKKGEVDFPRKVLSEGSGPSLLYNAYQELKGIVKVNGHKVPTIFDRDISQLMLDKGNNPNKILGNMTGENSLVKASSFDMVDHESITLLRNPDEVKNTLLEANRVLKPKGTLEIVLKNKRFLDSFYPGLEKLGFELITGKEEGFSLSKPAFKRLRAEQGEHFAESYASKLANTRVIIARKEAAPAQVDANDLWFGTMGYEEEKKEDHQEKEVIALHPSESRNIIMPRSRRKGAKPRLLRQNVIEPNLQYNVDSRGVVQEIKKLGGK